MGLDCGNELSELPITRSSELFNFLQFTTVALVSVSASFLTNSKGTHILDLSIEIKDKRIQLGTVHTTNAKKDLHNRFDTGNSNSHVFPLIRLFPNVSSAHSGWC